MTARQVCLEVQAATREQDGQPFVRLALGGESVLMDPDDARQVAMMISDVAGQAETEAGIVRTLRALQIDADPEVFIGTLVAERARIRREAGIRVN